MYSKKKQLEGEKRETNLNKTTDESNIYMFFNPTVCMDRYKPVSPFSTLPSVVSSSSSYTQDIAFGAVLNSHCISLCHSYVKL